MAEAEIRFRAVLQDDASRGIDALDNKIQASGTKAATASSRIGQSATKAAEQVRSSTSRMAAGFANAGRAIKDSVAPVGRFVDGFKSAGAAASTFSGKMGSLGGVARRAADGVGGAFRTMGGAVKSAATAGVNIGRSLKDGITRQVASAKAAVGEQLKSLGKGAALAVGVGVGAVVMSAVKNAAELEQTMGALDAVFKGNAGQMVQWSNEAARTVGLSKVEYQSLATVLGASLKNGGMALDEVGGKTNELITVGADLASMFGGTTKEAVQAMTAALRGESDPIERYGVSLTAAKIEAEALAMGANKVNGELTTQAKQAAILSLVSKQTADAQGNFARETGTFSGALQIFRAQWANLTTQWASNVIPMLSTLVVWFSDKIIPALGNASNAVGAFFAFLKGGDQADWGVLEGFDQTMANVGLALHNAAKAAADMWARAQPLFDFVARHKDVFGTLAIGIGIAAAAMGTLTAVTWLLNAALVVAFSPVVLIGVFIGAVILAYNKIGWFKDGVNSAWETIKVGASAVGTAIAWVWNFVATTGQAAWRNVTTNVTAAIDGVKAGWNGITTFFTTLWTVITTATRVAWEGIKAVLVGVADWFANTGRAAWDGAVRAVGAVFTWLKDTIVTPVWNAIRGQIAVVVGVIMTLWDGLVWAARNVLGPAFTWLNTNAVQPAWRAIQAAIQAVASWWTGTAVPAFQSAINALQSTWTALRVLVAAVWTAIRTAVQTAWTFIQNSVLTPAINFIRGALTAAWTFIRDTVNTVWTAIRTASLNAWNFLRSSVFQPVINFIRGALTQAWTFIRDTINTVWTAIRTASINAWNYLRNSIFQPVINFIRGPLTQAWTYIRDTTSNVWNAIRTASINAWNYLRNSVLQPIVNFLRGALTQAWTTTRDTITNAWNAVRDRVRSGWDSIRTGTFDPMVRFVKETIPNAFTNARDAIGRGWEGVKTKITTPINDAVRAIKTTLLGNINNVLRQFNMPLIDIGFNTPSGGGFRDGGYTGPGHPGAPAGVVHRDEQVIRSPARRSIEDTFPGLLDRMNRQGAAALGAAAPGAAVYNGKTSFSGGLTQQVFNAGRLNVSGSAPGYDLAGAIRMVDNATRVKVAAGGGSPNVNVTAGNFPDWWAGYFSGNTVRLNNRVAGSMGAPAKRVLVAHEIGHALGLPHSDPGGGQSMMSYANMYQHNSVTPADVKALSAIYGGTGFASGGIDWKAILTKGLDAIWNGIGSTFRGPGGQMAMGGGKWLTKKAIEWGTKKFAGAARGLTIPGYGPGNDIIPILASPGESVLTPQLTRALGADNIRAANIASTGNRAGGSGSAVSMLGTGSGGGVTVNVELSVTVEGNADMDVIERLEADLEPMLYRIIDDANRRGY